MPALNALYRQYTDRVAFFVIYIEEAHPIDGWQVQENVADDVLFPRGDTFAERADVAGLCLTRLAIELPALIDGDDNSVERAYTGWPDRLYVIGTDGRVAYKSAAGPFGFRPVEVEATLKNIVGR